MILLLVTSVQNHRTSLKKISIEFICQQSVVISIYIVFLCQQLSFVNIDATFLFQQKVRFDMYCCCVYLSTVSLYIHWYCVYLFGNTIQCLFFVSQSYPPLFLVRRSSLISINNIAFTQCHSINSIFWKFRKFEIDRQFRIMSLSVYLVFYTT